MRATKDVILSGIQPTGILHLGNYLGAVQNWVKMQNLDNTERYYCIVDLHSITTRYVGKDILDENVPQTLETTLKTAASLLACGIDIKKSNLFVQSHVPAHTELAWILMCFTPMSWLNKMIQYKEKKKDGDHTSIGLFNYPWLMAADIMLYQATKVPVGEDQTQHLELTRDLVERVNMYASLNLPLPDKIESEHQRVMSLINADNKMSKSDISERSRINLIDDAEMIREKIKRAKTDSLGKISYDPNRKELYNLLNIYASIKHVDTNALDSLFANDDMSSFKMKLADVLIDQIWPIGERILTIQREEGYILESLEQGAKNANKKAAETMDYLYKHLKIKK